MKKETLLEEKLVLVFFNHGYWKRNLVDACGGWSYTEYYTTSQYNLRHFALERPKREVITRRDEVEECFYSSTESLSFSEEQWNIYMERLTTVSFNCIHLLKTDEQLEADEWSFQRFSAEASHPEETWVKTLLRL